MGRQDANRLRGDSRDRGLSEMEGYRLFLSEALEGKRPGLDRIALTPVCPSAEIMDTFQTPMIPHQNYTVVEIDATAFEGGTLTLDIGVGRGKAAGIFYLFDGDQNLPTEKAPEGISTSVWERQQGDAYVAALDALAIEWYIGPEKTEKITYPFDQGKLFRLCVTGSVYGVRGSLNAFSLKISVKEKTMVKTTNEVIKNA